MNVNVDVCTKEEFRMFSGVLTCLVLDGLIVYFFNPQGVMLLLLCIFGGLQFWFITMFSSLAPSDSFTIDLRTNWEKEQQQREHTENLIRSKQNMIKLQLIDGTISKDKFEEGMSLLNELLHNEQKLLN